MYSQPRTNGHSPGIVDRTREEAQAFMSDFSDVRSELQSLAQKEMELFRAEIAEQRQAAMQTALFGGLTALAGLMTFAFVAVTLMLILDSFMDSWLAAFITTLVLGALTAAAAMMARERMRLLSLTPKRTIKTLREDAQWARDLLRSNVR
jgi:uncharacterized membrane protein YqjE